MYADTTYTDCPSAKIAITVYEEKTTAKLNDFRKTGRATEESYKLEVGNYNFAKHRAINKKMSSIEKFANIVWAKTNRVGFAIRDKYAVLAYCQKTKVTYLTKKTCYDCLSAGLTTEDCTATSCEAGTGCETTNKKEDGYCENVK